MKSIKTTTHNPNKVRLQDLVSDDPGMPEPWANGEPEEVEVEWKLMQTEFGAAGGGPNGELEGGPEDLPDGDEIITRRYEFYKYEGPIDAESGEAMASEVASDGLHGVGTVTYNHHIDPSTGEWVTETVDLSTLVVVGEFFGAQMSGFDVAPLLGMIDNLQDGELNVAYPDRRIVIGGADPFTATITSGSLPNGMSFDSFTGVLSGTPTQTGAFTFTVEATDLGQNQVAHTYTLTIVGAPNEGSYSITTSAMPAAGGSTTGGGVYYIGDQATVVATANPGYFFVYWAEADVHFCFTPSYTFTVNASRDLVATFAADSVAPVTDAAVSGPLGANGWYVGAAEVTLTSNDDLSGVAATDYRVDASGPQLYAGPFSIGNGVHTVEYWSVDVAQNVETFHTLTLNVDGVAPDVSAQATPSALKPANGKMVAVTVAGSVTDGISGPDGLSGTFFTEDSYGQVQPAGTFAIQPDGKYSFTVMLEAKLVKKATVARSYTITLQALDLAGNLGTNTVTVTVPTKK